MATEQQVVLKGLSRADKLDISALDGEGKVSFRSEERDESRMGEPATLIAILGLGALFVIAAWLVKDRFNDTVELTFEIKNADGSSRQVKYRRKITKETSDAEVVKELQSLFKMSP